MTGRGAGIHLVIFESYCGEIYGNQRYILLLLRNAASSGMRITLVCPRPGKLVDAAVAQGHTAVVIGAGDRLTRHGGQLLRGGPAAKAVTLAHLLIYAWRLRAWLRRSDADVVQCNNTRSLLMAGFAARTCGRPLLWYIKGELEDRRLARLAARLASRICVISTTLREDMGRLLGPRAAARVQELPIGVDFGPLERVRAAAPSRGGGDATIRFCFVGFCAPEKGVGVLLEAFSQLARSGRDVELVLIGAPASSDYLALLKTRVRQWGIAERVAFLGWRDDIPEQLVSSDVFVLPSFSEGFPRSIIEAQACGLPVIATRVGGIGERVHDGINGVLVEAADVAALAGAMTALAQDGELRRNMGRAGQDEVQDRYGITSHLQCLRGILDAMMRTHGPKSLPGGRHR